jgi:hypothetical protein
LKDLMELIMDYKKNGVISMFLWYSV